MRFEKLYEFLANLFFVRAIYRDRDIVALPEGQCHESHDGFQIGLAQLVANSDQAFVLEHGFHYHG